MTIRKSGGKRVRLWELDDAKPGTVIEKLQRSYLDSLAAVDDMEAARAAFANDRRYTPDGVKEEMRQHVLRNAVPVFHRGRRAIEQARRQLADMNAKLQPPKADPADAAGAIARMEIRTWLRGLPQSERDAITGSSKLDPQIRAAIVEAPPQMTGVAESHRGLILESIMRETHGELIDEAAELATAIEAAESAVEGGRDAARLDLEIYDPAVFNEMAAPIEKREAAPWLQKHKDAAGNDEIRVVDLERSIARIATPEEIETGIFYRDFADYQQQRSAA
jgi:hypothetical protein